MFEPIHGSAPDIVGKGTANPLGQIWSGALMLEHLGEASASARLVSAMEEVLASGVRTPDLGGTQGTEQVTDAVTQAFIRLGSLA
jgi:tartrate dehydrogenase/decarboxylase/D-malate dehydrogenase